jgi:hypothetical protein
LYDCGAWYFTFREECKLRVFENRVLRGIFGPTREEVAGGWRRLHNEELRNLYISPSIVRVVKSRMGVSEGYNTPGIKICIQYFGWQA